MDDYISQEALLSATEGYDWQAGLKTVLKRTPAADVRPVVRGKWVESFPLEVECSCCKFRLKSLLKIWYKFCPNCGADMREEI